MIELKQYRDPLMSEKFDEAIGFFPREFYCLDNFSAFKVLYKGILYSTVEHAYQAYKFIGVDDDIAKEIMEAYSPHEAQKIARINKEKRRKDWEEVKAAIMEEIIRCKVEQNPYVKQKLLQTKNYTIVEDSPHDNYWGWGEDRKGQNQMGKLWMKIREEYQKKEQI